MIKILPSLASANQMRLESEIRKVESLGRLHFDIEDGNFVPNITFGMKTTRSACMLIPGISKDAHLMVTNPADYLDGLAECGFDAVSFHWEAAPYPMRLINRIRQLGMRSGIAVNPRTPACEIEDYLADVDYVLVMSSEPDGAGECFQQRVLEKVRRLRQWNSSIEIIVDGGVNLDNIQSVISAGANGVVLGRAIFAAEDVNQIVEKFQQKGCAKQ